jgi:hypothetical protein
VPGGRSNASGRGGAGPRAVRTSSSRRCSSRMVASDRPARPCFAAPLPGCRLPAADRARARRLHALLQLGAGRQARCVEFPPGAEPLGSRPAVLAVGTAEQGSSPVDRRVEVEQRRRHGIEQPAVVRHEDRDPLVSQQPFGEAVERGVVEVAARLVEQDRARRFRERAREPEPVAPADRQLPQRRGGSVGGAELLQRRVQAAIGAPRIQALGAGERARVPVIGARVLAQSVRGGLELGRRPARRGDGLRPQVGDHRRRGRSELLLDGALADPLRRSRAARWAEARSTKTGMAQFPDVEARTKCRGRTGRGDGARARRPR